MEMAAAMNGQRVGRGMIAFLLVSPDSMSALTQNNEVFMLTKYDTFDKVKGHGNVV